MDNIKFGAFVAQLRKEQSMTQRELADRLNVTDKAISKWETGKGFPDVQLLGPLAQALGVSLAELLQGERSQRDSLPMDEMDSLLSQAMNQSQRVTARRYLKLLRWLLTAIGVFLILPLLKSLFDIVQFKAAFHDYGIIGGADGPTAILTTSSPSVIQGLCFLLFLIVVVILCIVLIFRIWKLEKELKS